MKLKTRILSLIILKDKLNSFGNTHKFNIIELFSKFMEEIEDIYEKEYESRFEDYRNINGKEIKS